MRRSGVRSRLRGGDRGYGSVLAAAGGVLFASVGTLVVLELVHMALTVNLGFYETPNFMSTY